MVTSRCVLFNHDTGNVPISISLKVPPPTAVTKAIIRIPKTSSFFRVAATTPENVKAIVPNISITKSSFTKYQALKKINY
jgi:hypothetical protein